MEIVHKFKINCGMMLGAFMRGAITILMKNRFNCTGIAVLLHGIGVIIGGVHFRPVKMSLACDTWYVVIDSLTAFLLGVIHYYRKISYFRRK
jgi:hypothetical protein